MSGQSRRLALIFLLTFAVAGTGLILFRASIRDTVVVPLLYLLWLGRLVFASLHQSVIWAGMLLLMLLLLGSSVPKKSAARVRKVPARPGEWEQNRRVKHWAAQVRRIDTADRWEPSSLAEFRRLILSVQGYRAGVRLWEAERDYRAGTLELPAEARLFLGDDARPPTGAEAAALGEEFRSSGRQDGDGRRMLRRRVRSTRALLAGRGARAKPHGAPHLQAMIAELESQLEVEDGDGDPPGRGPL